MNLQTIIIINTICGICNLVALGAIAYYVKKFVEFVLKEATNE